MGRSINERLWSEWRRRLARYEQWRGTLAAFCDAEGVAVGSFHQWRRKLQGRPADAARRELAAAEPTSPTFLPVRVEFADPLEVELPNGVRVRVPFGAGRTLGDVLAAAANCVVTPARETRPC